VPKTIHHSGWPVSGELCVVQMVKVTVQNTLINLRGLRPRQQRETKTAMDNSPQRLVCVRRAVRATGGRGDRVEHNRRATRPAAAAISRKGNKTQNLRLAKLAAAALPPPESCACYRSCKPLSRTQQKIRAACGRGNSEKQPKKSKSPSKWPSEAPIQGFNNSFIHSEAYGQRGCCYWPPHPCKT